MKIENHITGRSEADEPSQIDNNREQNNDGDRSYLPSSKVRRDPFYCDEREYKQKIQGIYDSYKEPDAEELAAFWHERPW
jgi:hypothetical protein